MKGIVKTITQLGVISLIALCLVGLQPAWANDCNISTNSPEYYAWSENVGWTNWHASNACVAVAPTYLVGYVWAENIGWIKLGSDGGGPYVNDASDDWGVNRDNGTGALSGYAWSENAGWINFNPEHGQVTWHSGTGQFDGYAWGENIGWIHFQNSFPSYYVELDGPLVVDLVSFSAQALEDRVLLTWETASEIDNAGFYLWRSETKDGSYSKITPALIPAEGTATSGATYTYNDTDVTPPQAWYYKLEDISNGGIRTFHGPVLGVVGDAAVKVVDGPTTIAEGDTAPGMGEIIIKGTGQHTVTTGKYADNPAGAPAFTPTGDYWFVDVTNPSGVDRVDIRLCPAAANNTVYYWNGSGWIKCSQQEYTDGCIAVTITHTTSPRISDLTNLIFAMGHQSVAIPTVSEWGMIILCLLLAVTGVVVMRRRRLGIRY